MKPVIDLEKEYGLVLEGGGAKGAYQIGVWKALREAGVKIKGVAGTSVGGLNGAMICMGNLEKAIDIWSNLTYSQIMDIDDEVAANLIRGSRPTKENVKESVTTLKEFIKNRGMDVTPLKNLIADFLDPKAIKESPMDFFVTTFNVDEMREEKINMKEVDENLLESYLLATAYMAPVFKVEKLNGTRYVDGGATDKVPVDVLLDEGYKDLIVVRIYGVGVTKRVEIPEDVSVLEIAPRADLGSILEFDGEHSRRNMVKGYLDGLRAIYGLNGLLYYIDNECSELDCLNRLLAVRDETKEEILSMYRVEDEKNLRARRFVEKVFPEIAAELKLGSEWTYQELFLGMLEATAKMCRVPRNRVYTVGELLGAVCERCENAQELDRDLDFVKIVLDMAHGGQVKEDLPDE